MRKKTHLASLHLNTMQMIPFSVSLCSTLQECADQFPEDDAIYIKGGFILGFIWIECLAILKAVTRILFSNGSNCLNFFVSYSATSVWPPFDDLQIIALHERRNNDIRREASALWSVRYLPSPSAGKAICELVHYNWTHATTFLITILLFCCTVRSVYIYVRSNYVKRLLKH